MRAGHYRSSTAAQGPDLAVLGREAARAERVLGSRGPHAPAPVGGLQGEVPGQRLAHVAVQHLHTIHPVKCLSWTNVFVQKLRLPLPSPVHTSVGFLVRGGPRGRGCRASSALQQRRCSGCQLPACACALAGVTGPAVFDGLPACQAAVATAPGWRRHGCCSTADICTQAAREAV